MAYSDVQIANMALSRVMVNQRIAALDEDSTEAAACALWLDPCRDMVLEDLDWPFARARVILAETTETPPDGWGYHYAYPAHVIALRGLDVGTSLAGLSLRYTYQVVYDEANDRQAILANVSPATMIYTHAITNPTLFPASFVHALAWRLAAELATDISKSRSLRDRCMQEYGLAMSGAAANAMNQESDGPAPEGESVQARGTSFTELDAIRQRLL